MWLAPARRRNRRRVSLSLLSFAVLFGAAGAAPALAQDWAALAGGMSAPWPALQRSNGTFPVHVDGHASGRHPYGEAMLGYGLLQTALRENDPTSISAALRALEWAARWNVVRARHRRPASDSVFENLALASAYRLARSSLRGRPEFERVRPELENALRRMRPVWLGGPRAYFNKHLVEAVAVLEMLRTGVRSRVPGAMLSDRRRARRLVTQLLGRLSGLARAGASRRPGARRAFFLSDPPVNPAAYHALSLGFLGRAVELLGPAKSRRVLPLLRSVAEASWELAAPDGDVAYFGRSQGQAWALPLTAYGAEVAARRSPPSSAARFRALAARAVDRLAAVHAGGPSGLWITRSLAIDPSSRGRGLDKYADSVAYSGLTIVGLNWAAAARTGGPVAALGSDVGSAHVLGAGDSRFGYVRTGDSWFAVKQGDSEATDLRYDFGIAAFKSRGSDGSWRDVLPPRPIAGKGTEPTGPILRTGGVSARPEGLRTTMLPGGGVLVHGRFVTPEGETVRPAAFRFEPSGRCLALSFESRAGERFDHSTFLSGVSAAAGAAVEAAGARVTYDPPATGVALRHGFASGSDPSLTRVQARIEPGARTVRIETCPR